MHAAKIQKYDLGRYGNILSVERVSRASPTLSLILSLTLTLIFTLTLTLTLTLISSLTPSLTLSLTLPLTSSDHPCLPPIAQQLESAALARRDEAARAVADARAAEDKLAAGMRVVCAGDHQIVAVETKHSSAECFRIFLILFLFPPEKKNSKTRISVVLVFRRNI